MNSGIILGYVGIAAIFAYLAINLDSQEHASFKMLNLIAAYLTTILTSLVTIQYVETEYPDTALLETVSGIGGYYVYILMFIFAYFVLYIIYQLADEMVNL